MAVNFADLTRTLVLAAIIGTTDSGTNKTKKYNYSGLSETGTADQVKRAGEAIASLMSVDVEAIYVRDINEVLESL